MRDDDDRHAVSGHLAEQADREVVRVAVRELVDAVECQRAGQHRVSGRGSLPGTRQPVFRPHRLPGQLFQLACVDEPGSGRRGEHDHAPPGALAPSHQRGNAFRRGCAAHHQVQHAVWERPLRAVVMHLLLMQVSSPPRSRREMSGIFAV
jgi:hypothetical protein